MSETEQIVEAKRDYQARETEELNIKRSEKLILLDDSKPRWQVKKNSGEVGYVPSNFVKKVESSNLVKKNKLGFASKLISLVKPQKKKASVGDNRQNQRARTPTSDTANGDDTLELPIATVISNYTAKHENELSLRVDKKVKVQEMPSNGWWLGECNGLSGWFPSNYVTDDDDTFELPIITEPIAVVVRNCTTGPIAVVIKDYAARQENELSFQKGGKVIVQEKSSDGWWRGECKGLSGWFPSNYVIELENTKLGSNKSNVSSAGKTSAVVDDFIFRVIAFSPYTGKDLVDLSFERGEQLDIVGMPEVYWWAARNKNGEIGMVPNNYLEVLDDDATPIVSNRTRSRAGSSATGGSSAEASGHQAVMSDPEQIVEVKEDNQAIGMQELPTSDTSDGDDTFEVPITTGPIAVVVKQYRARQEDELGLLKGDQVMVQDKSSDGWWLGECEELSGWFPSNCVIELMENVSGSNKSYVRSRGKKGAVVDDFIFRVVALYPFIRRNMGDLHSFEQGEQLDIVEVSEPNWWKARNKNGEIGMVPNNYLDILEDDATPIVGKRTQSSAESSATGGSSPEASGHQTDQSPDERNSESILEYHEYLGGGASGEVHRVTWKKANHQSIEAAAKKVRITEDNSDEDILREADLLKKLNHVNVIKFFGLITTESHVVIVTEYASRGSLRGILKRRRKGKLSKRLFDKWLLEAALGIQYAHHQNIVHCDVKSDNFVVSGEDILKLCDLGIARHLSQTAMTSKEAGTEFWLAPEVFIEQLRSPACDVYSYGVVVWELYTCDYPGKGFNVPGAFKWKVGTQNYRLPIPGDCPASVRNLIERCWLEEYKQRPTMDKVVRYIQEGHSGVEELR